MQIKFVTTAGPRLQIGARVFTVSIAGEKEPWSFQIVAFEEGNPRRRHPLSRTFARKMDAQVAWAEGFQVLETLSADAKLVVDTLLAQKIALRL